MTAASAPAESARYWQHDAVPGVDLLRARYVTHRYARHSHETYTVGVIEAGVEEFAYGSELLRAGPGTVALLNPEVVHTGQAGVPEGWAYRVLYPSVELVTTDGFLLPNAVLESRGLLGRKGFPESYDRRALLRFVSRVKSGAAEVRAPFYSHLNYDIVPNAEIVVNQPDILIVEGLNVLQPPAPGTRLAVSDLFDFSIYVDARTSDIERWYVERFLRLQRGAFTDPDSYFHRYAELSEPEAIKQARSIWREINGPNLAQNVLPTRARASLVLRKDADHAVSSVLVRKL